MTEQESDISVKSALEMLNSLLDDYNSVFDPYIERLTTICLNHLDSLRENDSIVLARSLVIKAMRDRSAPLFGSNDALSRLTSNL